MALQSMIMQRGISSIATIAILAVVGTLMYLVLVGGSNTGVSTKIHAGELYPVQRGSFDISIPTSGELSAENRINIHNKLESGAVIIELVDEGSIVSKGDILLRLNDESIKNEIRNSETSVTSARDNYETALASLAISENFSLSEFKIILSNTFEERAAMMA